MCLERSIRFAKACFLRSSAGVGKDEEVATDEVEKGAVELRVAKGLTFDAIAARCFFRVAESQSKGGATQGQNEVPVCRGVAYQIRPGRKLGCRRVGEWEEQRMR